MPPVILGDACDPDIDGDGHNNTMDAFDRDPTEWDDTDNDTIGDNADNCPNTKNADQINRYGNLSIGDACEDSDGDGILDLNDNCPLSANPNQANLDNATDDPLGDACDPDIDGDGHNNTMDAFDRDPTEWDDTDNDTIGDNADNCPLLANHNQNDLDRDGDGDPCDLDYDNDGTHEIRNTYQLDMVRVNRSADYILEADINLINHTNWEPIGDHGNPFIGTFDGRNHTIGNLTSQNRLYVGLFGRVIGATIHNLRLEVHNLSASEVGASVGSLAGDASNSNVSNVHAIVNGPITGSSLWWPSHAGGLIGFAGPAIRIADSHATVRGSISAYSVVDNAHAGGLIGESTLGSTIINSYARVAHNISARARPTAKVGGLIGVLRDTQLVNSYAFVDGSLTAAADRAYAGGLIGDSQDSPSMDVYAQVSDHVLAQGQSVSYVGGLVGYLQAGIIRRHLANFHSNLTRSYTVIQGHLSATADTPLPNPGQSATGPFIGGLIGHANRQYNLTHSYYSARRAQTDPHASFTNTNGTSRSLDQLACPTTPGQHCQGVRTYTGWNASLWDFGTVTTLPTLRPMQRHDSDGDGILNLHDTCPYTASQNQADSDGDGYGDVCDALPANATEHKDTDSDMIGDNTDNCLTIPNPDQANRYGDPALGDACEDSDNDGVFDDRDNCPNTINPGQANFDHATGDRHGDLCDPDYDNDNLIDIRTAAQLDAVRANLSAAYELVAHIDLARYANWQPLGNRSNPFTGRFNGQGHIISNLSIDGNQYAGLFGYIVGATLSNLSLSVNSIHALPSPQSAAGALVGYADNSEIREIQAIVAGNISVAAAQAVLPRNNFYAGGLIGRMDGSHLTLSHVRMLGAVLAMDPAGRSSYAGGLVGLNSNGLLTSSYALVKGRIAANASHAYTGGLVGALERATQVNNTYAVIEDRVQARATEYSYAGGLTGHLQRSEIDNSYVVIMEGVSSTSNYISYAGGLAGYVNRSTVANSYMDARRRNGIFTNAYGFARSLLQLVCPRIPGEHCQGARTYTGWDTSLWDFGDDRSLPIISPNPARDSDGDGRADRIDNCRFTFNPDQNNFDGDPDGDACDEDIDGDGRNNAADAFDYDPHEQDDTDHDSIGDNTDNCPTIANRYQHNLDGDTQGDLCDPDYDNDGIREIQTPAQLDAVRTNLSVHYELIADIDLDGHANWAPLGDRGDPFTGTFDGRGHTIGNLTISGNQDAGLFGYTSRATLQNISLYVNRVHALSSHEASAGTLAGYAHRSNLSAIRVTVIGNISVATSQIPDQFNSVAAVAGGLVGNIDGGSIKNAYVVLKSVLATNNSNYNSYAGGLVGRSENITLSDSNAQVEERISASAFNRRRGRNTPLYPEASVGGLIGWDRGSLISNSYARVTHRLFASAYNAYAGGLAGRIEEGGHTNNTYALLVGYIHARSAVGSSYAGGLIGYLASRNSINSSYAAINNGVSSSGGSTYAGGLVGHVEVVNIPGARTTLGRSYYAAQRGTYPVQNSAFTNTHGLARSLGQLECPTMPGEDCLGAISYLGWDSTLWNFGDNRTLPTLRRHLN